MIKGKILFKDIFHNRQLGMVYVSYFIQNIFHPQNLYYLIFYHRLFVITTSFIFGTFFVVRFGYPALLTSIFIELTRFFFFGMMFQGESIIIYPILYLSGLILEKRTLAIFDFIFIGLFSFFIIFTRETYIPLTLFLFIWLLVKNWRSKFRLLPIILLSFFSLLTLNTLPLKDYFYNLIYVNRHAGFESEINPIKSFLYPLYIFIAGNSSFTKIIYSFISLGFIFSGIFLQSPLLLIVLGLAILRVVLPGTELFAGYKVFIWFGLITYFTVYAAFTIKGKRKLMVGSLLSLALFCLFFLPQSIIFKKVNRMTEFDIFYSRYFSKGEIIKALADKNDTLFVDGYDSLLFWTSQLPSSYKHTFYYSVVNKIPRYTEDRIQMFHEDPPTFYYRDCLEKNLALPPFVIPAYKELKDHKKSTCLYVKRAKLQNLSEKQKDTLTFFHVTF